MLRGRHVLLRRLLPGLALVALAAALTGLSGEASTAAPRTSADLSHTLPLAFGDSVPTAAAAVPDPAPKCGVKVASSVFATATPAAIAHGKGVICTTVAAPLDYSGLVPGTVPLHVEVLPAPHPRGVMFLIAGGPGQGSADVFALTTPKYINQMHYLFPGYTLVAYDDRGTGRSGLLKCPNLFHGTVANVRLGVAGACAETIGAQRVYYGTPDHADDLEAVRAALNLGKVGVYGTSYGTELAIAYALAYPQNVSRILLDSVRPVNSNDLSTYRQMEKAMRSYCGDGLCRAATPDYAHDVVTLVNKLAAHPASTQVFTSSGKVKVEKVGGDDVLSLVLDSDLSSGLAAQMPAAVHAGIEGDYRDLARIRDLQFSSDPTDQGDTPSFSEALNIATNCIDAPVPWTRDTPVNQRRAKLTAAQHAEPANTYGPFGKWLDETSLASLCITWPPTAIATPFGKGPLPNVPMLAVDGSYDMRTPNSDARAVTKLFPQGKLVIVPGIGHSVTTQDPSGCIRTVIRHWTLGRKVVSGDCPRPTYDIDPLPAYPADSTTVRTPAQTLAIALTTVHAAEADWQAFIHPEGTATVTALDGGTIHGTPDGFTLNGYSITPGISVSGTFKRGPTLHPLRFSGTLNVGGNLAAVGNLKYTHGKLSGKLGGAKVRG